MTERRVCSCELARAPDDCCVRGSLQRWCPPAQAGGMSREVSVIGPFGPVPCLVVMVKVTLSAPAGTGVGK